MTIEREEHPEGTPLGGTYSVTVYQDADGNEADRKSAVRALVSEYDAEDRWLGETVVVYGAPPTELPVRLQNGNLLVPERAESQDGEVLGDGVREVEPRSGVRAVAARR